MATHKIRKCILPVAGLGTRFLPATKAVPKEMLPVVDKPLIQYATEEAVAAGIDTLIFITGHNKRAIEDHYSKAYELEDKLTDKGERELLEVVRSSVPEHVTCIFIRQGEALGLGHAVLCARRAVGDEPFAVILPDDLIANEEELCLEQMADVYADNGNSLIAVETVPPNQTDQYGIVQVDDPSANISRISSIIEKPSPAQTHSSLGVVGRYILNPRIFDLLENTQRGAGNEIQLTDAISSLLTEEKVNAFSFSGIRYDCGSTGGLMEASIAYALARPELRERLLNNMKRIVEKEC